MNDEATQFLLDKIAGFDRRAAEDKAAVDELVRLASLDEMTSEDVTKALEPESPVEKLVRLAQQEGR